MQHTWRCGNDCQGHICDSTHPSSSSVKGYRSRYCSVSISLPYSLASKQKHLNDFDFWMSVRVHVHSHNSDTAVTCSKELEVTTFSDAPLGYWYIRNPKICLQYESAWPAPVTHYQHDDWLLTNKPRALNIKLRHWWETTILNPLI